MAKTVSFIKPTSPTEAVSNDNHLDEPKGKSLNVIISFIKEFRNLMKT